MLSCCCGSFGNNFVAMANSKLGSNCSLALLFNTFIVYFIFAVNLQIDWHKSIMCMHVCGYAIYLRVRRFHYSQVITELDFSVFK